MPQCAGTSLEAHSPGLALLSPSHHNGQDERDRSEEGRELVGRERRLTKDRAQSAGSELSMHWHDDRPPLRVAELDVASPLADLFEANGTQCSHGVLA